MDVPVIDVLDSPTNNHFVTEFDSIPSFWNYLVGLDRTDLLAELIQNDLDQGATCSVVSFERTRLVCDGNGRPVEPDGWRRLRKILGAGDEVPAKVSKFGVKNHGLKTAFTIGDEIRLLSAGQAIVQTLYANGRGKRPHPGSSSMPMRDQQAPDIGCRVIIRYRDEDLEPRQGETLKLKAVATQDVDTLFRTACGSLPEQFAGIVSPETTPRYEIVLRHWELGEARFLFSCTRPRKIAKRLEFFRRHCTVSGTFNPLPEALSEQAVRRSIPLKGALKDRAADFFRRGNGFYVEASWPIDKSGKPNTGTGRFRYPIGYPPNSHQARTGHSTNFNAPFASDSERHAPARNEATNEELRDACNSLLIDALVHHAIPRWGADGLRPLVPSPDAQDEEEVVRPLLATLVEKRALPVLKWREAAELALKGKRKALRGIVRRLSARRTSDETRRYRFVVPALTWAKSEVCPALSVLCPGSEMQLDPRTHPKIIRLLADRNTPGFAQDFITFNENDVFYRVTGDEKQSFGTVTDPERDFSEPLIAWTYLDLFKLALDQGTFDRTKEDTLIAALRLPDAHCKLAPLSEMHSSNSLPSDILTLHLPPFLHPALLGHRLFRRSKWRRSKYTMDLFLESGVLQVAADETRRRFWKWLRRNQRRIAPRLRTKLAELPIWPDEKGRLCRISDLCIPRSPRIAAVLADAVRHPHEQVRSSILATVGGKTRTSIRRVPSEGEIASWLDARVVEWEIGSAADAATTDKLRGFEDELTLLMEDTSIARLVKAARLTLPALAQDGSIRPRTTLVMPSHSNDRLGLPDRFMLKNRGRAVALDKLSPALREPTGAMLLDALAEDPGNLPVLHLRLSRLLSVTSPEDDERIRVAEMPIIPVNGELRNPSELAFTRVAGDYWGHWKTPVTGKGLSQDDQRRYRDVGVTSSSPRPETSRAFFEWLGTQDESVLEQHIAHVLRHVLHRDGPRSWAQVFTQTPFIPTKGQHGLRLVSLRTALRQPIYIPDAGDICDKIVSVDSHVLLTIDHVKEVTEPISEILRGLGVRSLREVLEEPESSVGRGQLGPANTDILRGFRALQSSRFQKTFLKRLNELGVEPNLVRRDWRDRLDKVKEIRFAEDVEVHYRFRGRTYVLEVDGGFDPGSGIFWMKRDLSVGRRRLYELIAKQLVFKPMARPIDLFALERTVGLEIDDPSFGRPTVPGSSSDSHHDPAARDGDYDDHQDVDPDPGEAATGHSPFEPNRTRNRPRPSPLPTGSTAHRRRVIAKQSSATSSETRGGTRQTPELEKEQKNALKRDHYASHCQMCLCDRRPQELAPTGSYIEWEEVRQHVIEAHHPDLVSAGGARHAGNLLLLCKLHHNNFGPQLSRAKVSSALRNDPKEVCISFDDDLPVKGKEIELKISGTGETVKLFFTNQHVKYWLAHDDVDSESIT